MTATETAFDSVPRRGLRRAALAMGLLASLLAAACSKKGSGAGSLSKRLQDSYLAGVATEQKREMLDAQYAWTVAKADRDKLATDVGAAKTAAAVASDELDAARAAERSKKRLKADADASADTTKINDAERELRTALKVSRAADAYRGYLGAYRDSLRVALRAADDNVLWREAQFELAKAKLAAANNIVPKGFVLADFEKQESSRAKRAASSKQGVDKARAGVGKRRDAWKKAQAEADAATGTTTTKPDPLVEVAPATPTAVPAPTLAPPPAPVAPAAPATPTLPAAPPATEPAPATPGT